MELFKQAASQEYQRQLEACYSLDSNCIGFVVMKVIDHDDFRCSYLYVCPTGCTTWPRLYGSLLLYVMVSWVATLIGKTGEDISLPVIMTMKRRRRSF